jgi:hypothetical protein
MPRRTTVSGITLCWSRAAWAPYENLIAAECVNATSIAVVAAAFAVPELTRSADIKVK